MLFNIIKNENLKPFIIILQAATFPTVMHALSRWAPPAERSLLVSTSFAGMSIGNCIIFPMGGVIISALNWEAVFYLSGKFLISVGELYVYWW